MIANSRTALMTAVFLIATLAAPAVGQPERGIEVGQKIEPGSAQTLERGNVLIPAEKGLTVLLFWSTWSPRSERALKLWETLEEEYGGHGITIYSVNADNQRMEEADIKRVRNYNTEKGVTLPVIIDSGLELFNEIGVIVLPTTLFFKPDGTLDYKYPGFPASAEFDIREDLEARLGVAGSPAAEEISDQEQIAYHPKNNALVFYSMGKRFEEKGLPEKAKARYLESLQRDQDFLDPLRALENLFFANGRTHESEERLKTLLKASGLKQMIGKVSVRDDVEEAGDASARSEPKPAPASTGEKKLTPMERMRLLMEQEKK